MPLLYDPARRIVHNGSTVTGDTVLAIETPAERWAYAVSIPPARSDDLGDGLVETTLRVRVRRGAVGIGLLSEDGTRFIKENGLAGPADWVETTIVTGENKDDGPLVIRNIAGSGTSGEVDIEIVKSVPIANLPQPSFPELIIDPQLFEKLTPWWGHVPSGFSVDWTGTLTRSDVWDYASDFLEIFGKNRFEKTSLPTKDEHVLDWLPLVQAVTGAKGVFRMAALGAGWGRWIAGGAALARQLGRDFRLLGVEAEPQHFEWMVRHMKDNNIGSDMATLICAAASGSPGDFWFAVGNSAAWYGQSIVSADEVGDPPDLTKFRRVKGITISEVVAHLSPIDYLHMDIQGTEAQFLRYAPDVLDRNVGMVNIGTHGLDIESELRLLFRKLGWTSVYDIEIGSTHSLRLGESLLKPVQFGDGVQVWKNPNFRNSAQ